MQSNMLTLNELVELAVKKNMSPIEMREQLISFTYGNLAIDHPEITREMVREQMGRLLAG